jgi:hypothetical protein
MRGVVLSQEFFRTRVRPGLVLAGAVITHKSLSALLLSTSVRGGSEELGSTVVKVF